MAINESELKPECIQIEVAARELVKLVPPAGIARSREVGFNTPSQPIERWGWKFPQDKLLTDMLLNSSARIVVATSEEYQLKPWLGYKFWAEPEKHPSFQKINILLYYSQSGDTAEKYYSLTLIKEEEPFIYFYGRRSSGSITGYSYLKARGKFRAQLEDLKLVNDLLTDQR